MVPSLPLIVSRMIDEHDERKATRAAGLTYHRVSFEFQGKRDRRANLASYEALSAERADAELAS